MSGRTGAGQHIEPGIQERGVGMQLVYDVVQNVMVFVIWMSLVNHLLEKSSFGKYIRFFLGLLFLLVVISPVVEAFAGENPIQVKLDLSFLDEKRADVQDAMELADEKTAEKMKQAYEDAMREQIQMLLGSEVAVEDVNAGFTEEFDRLQGVAVVLRKKMKEETEEMSEGERGADVRGEAASDGSREGDGANPPIDQVDIGKIVIGQEKGGNLQAHSGDGGEKEGEMEKQGEYIERIAAYYGLEETSVTLEWK